MIELPQFSEQSMYDSETHFSMQMSLERLSKFIIHYEAMKLTLDIPGAIVECGVFKGTSLIRFAKLRQLLSSNYGKKIVAFDVFSNEFPDTEFEEDKKQREHWISTAGGSSISTEQLSNILKRFNIDNVDLIAGDARHTVPKYAEENKGFKISLLNIDIDFVEPTYQVLNTFYDRVMKGGVILLDNYAGEGTSGISYHGDTAGVDRFISERNLDVTIKQFPFAARPAFIIKKD